MNDNKLFIATLIGVKPQPSHRSSQELTVKFSRISRINSCWVGSLKIDHGGNIYTEKKKKRISLAWRLLVSIIDLSKIILLYINTVGKMSSYNVEAN